MRNTRLEQRYQADITQILLEDGYRTFARLFNLFTLILTDDPNCVGYTRFDDAVICLNINLNDRGFSVVTRHELLHQWLDHHERIIKHVAKKEGLDPKKDVDTLTREIYGDPKRRDNIAADWDLSKYYTDDDKYNSRDLSRMFSDEVAQSYKAVKGLILEDAHEDWLELTYEQLYDKLLEDDANLPQQPPPPENGGQGQSGQQGQQGQSGQSGQQGQQGQSGQSGSDSGEGEGQEGKGKEGENQQGAGKGNDGKQSKKSSKGSKGSNSGSGSDSSSKGQPGGDGQSGNRGASTGDTSKAETSGSSNANSNGENDISDHAHRQVQIGDFDPEWQEKEAKAREEKVKDEIAKGKQEDKSEEQLQKEREEQLRKLEKEVNNPTNLDAIKMSVADKKSADYERKERIRKARDKTHAFRGDIEIFKRDIRTFAKSVKDEASLRGKTWSRLDRKNQNPSMMRKGTKNLPSGKIPFVKVYFDVSGSCQPYIDRIMEILSALRELQNKYHLIKLDIKYFADRLGKDENDEHVGGGNSHSANVAIIEDIKNAQADGTPVNVIVLTDGDSDGTYEHIAVKGNVWWLWSHGRKAEGFMEAIRSRKNQNLEYIVQ